MSPEIKARGGTNFPLTILFITWKKSLNLLSLNASKAAYTKSLSLISFDKFCSSWIKSNFSSFCLRSSIAVESYQSLILESLPPVIIIKFDVFSSSKFTKFSEKSIAQILSSCISKLFKQDYLLTFQTFTIPSTLAEASCSPAFNQITLTRDILCPWSVLTHWWVSKFQIFRSLSPDADTKTYSAGLN